MDKWQALHNFWSGFSIPAYDENSVPDDAVMPYITYTAVTSRFEDVVLLSASIWYYSTSWADISNKADEIAEALSPYILIPIEDSQYLFMTQGAPFAQRMRDENSNVKRIYINVTGEYFARK